MFYLGGIGDNDWVFSFWIKLVKTQTEFPLYLFQIRIHIIITWQLINNIYFFGYSISKNYLQYNFYCDQGLFIYLYVYVQILIVF